MTGYVMDAQGSRTALPPLLRWKLTTTLGEPADSFSLTFPYAARWEPVLQKAVRFQAMDGGESRFYGVVDEYEISCDREGMLVTVHGRGMAGLLMDNQVGQKEYYWVHLTDILKAYVYPYGITSVRYDQDWYLGAYAVSYGVTAWQALCGFTMWSAGITPRFLPDGTLMISGAEGKRRTLLHPDRVREARFSGCRYGVYSHVVAKSAATGLETTVADEHFAALGGQATRRSTIPRKNSCRAGSASPQQVLQASREEYRVLELKLGELYAGNPGELITVDLPKLGISGLFRVREAENSYGVDGKTCTLTMGQV